MRIGSCIFKKLVILLVIIRYIFGKDFLILKKNKVTKKTNKIWLVHISPTAWLCELIWGGNSELSEVPNKEFLHRYYSKIILRGKHNRIIYIAHIINEPPNYIVIVMQGELLIWLI